MEIYMGERESNKWPRFATLWVVFSSFFSGGFTVLPDQPAMTGWIFVGSARKNDSLHA